jgi:hypothetical protein
MARWRKGTAIVTIGVGLYLASLPFALSLFSRTRDAELIRDQLQTLTSDAGLDQFQANLDTLTGGGSELFATVIPRLEQDLHLTDAEFKSFVAQNYPHVALFLEHAPDVLAAVEPASRAVLAQRSNIKAANSFPVASIPVTAGPWALLALGVGLIGAGVGVLLSERVVPTALVALAGLGLVVGPLVLDWPHKTSAAAEVAQAARSPFSPTTANYVVTEVNTLDAAILEIRMALLPSIGRQLDMNSDQLTQYLGSNFPAFTHLLDRWQNGMGASAHKRALQQIEFSDEFRNANATPYRALPYLVIAPGLLLLAACSTSLAYTRRVTYSTSLKTADAKADPKDRSLDRSPSRSAH